MWNQEDQQQDRYQAQRSVATKKKWGKSQLSKMEQILLFKSCQIRRHSLRVCLELMEKKRKGNLKKNLFHSLVCRERGEDLCTVKFSVHFPPILFSFLLSFSSSSKQIFNFNGCFSTGIQGSLFRELICYCVSTKSTNFTLSPSIIFVIY